jgi:hypothetical protein
MLLSKRKQIAIAQEANIGTAETLALGDAILTTDEPTWEPDVEVIERNATSASLASRGIVTGARKATINFKMYMRGTAAAPTGGNQPDYAMPFIGCGLGIPGAIYSGGSPNEIATWKPSTAVVTDPTAAAGMTVGMYADGKRYQIHGAMGNCIMTLLRGNPIMLDFSFTGVYETPVDAALLVPVYETTVPPTFSSATISVLGYASALINQLTIDLGNEVSMRTDPTTASAFLAAQIVGRRITGTIDVEEELVSAKDWYAAFLAGTESTIVTGDRRGAHPLASAAAPVRGGRAQDQVCVAERGPDAAPQDAPGWNDPAQVADARTCAGDGEEVLPRVHPILRPRLAGRRQARGHTVRRREDGDADPSIGHLVRGHH